MIPIYEGTAAEAGEKGELDLWRASHWESIRCREAIDETIRQHFDGMYLDHDIHLPIIEEFGMDRVNQVLAATLAYKSHDGRLSPRNKEWGAGIGLQAEERHLPDYTARSHPAVLNGFIDMVREYNEQIEDESAEEAQDDDPDESDSMVMQ